MTSDKVKEMIRRNIKELQEKIAFAEQEAKSSGKCHKRDYNKYVRNLKRDLYQYKEYTKNFLKNGEEKG